VGWVVFEVGIDASSKARIFAAAGPPDGALRRQMERIDVSDPEAK
jgi:hypothetical protein